MKRLRNVLPGLVVLALALPLLSAPTEKEKQAAVKEALQAVQDFIGDWKGAGGPDKVGKAPPGSDWSETVNWGWKFKGDDAWLVMEVKNGKFLKGGELRYDPVKQKYLFTAKYTNDKTVVFEGVLKNEALVLERVDPETKETQRFWMNSAAEGARFIYRYEFKPESTTVFRKDYMVATTREGVTLGPGAKKNECVVSGGLGTMQVSYKGETYYVCCSGCAEAFKDNPEKCIAEFKARKAKKP